MDNNFLVTYASKYGATKEIAEKIGEVLQKSDFSVDLAPVESVKDLSPYKAVVLGAALYVGKWHKPGFDFLKTNEIALAGKQVWIFQSGPSGEGDPVVLVGGQSLPPEIKAITDRIHPRDIALFHGNIDEKKVNFMERMAVKNIVKKPFGDYRDWNMIAAWAGKIAGAMMS
jgi:menaquinone-dependent protoporphyrinogen oxidase